ncbi:MAG: hypothetical protein QM539_01700 [Alphaproteobacteria bacterium]|nr:hypothetical protein [Alphaproteobacteria bacterium]
MYKFNQLESDLEDDIDDNRMSLFDQIKIEGKIEGKIDSIKKSLKRGKLSILEIAEDFEVSLDFVQKIKNDNQL